ncbi:twin-arginine translocase TatA/TatE family subunit [Saccharopolyspora sp. ASAGF58]|uniref:twin-arginine translocase TatA/TatE family subunit n=1 Tax=Saccharopolyspora sp. ASAGF58 TaxID=2719023 RepID=UPI00143FBA81|nr:twin-arginine translocase TatA/TatE family subunit [Saccharopolyspora sp. ASAGF58]QIZ38999.1 Sec-independent protein translocase subunit TatB [Saccharopolyspora sp. ASAGF58]
MSLEHLTVLLLAGLFILGPEKLPDAAAWAGRTIRQVRGFAADAQQQLRSELGDEYRDLREPLRQLNELRGLDPRRAVANYLLDDARPTTTLAGQPTNAAANSVERPGFLRPGERPPFDVEAT